MKSHRDYRRYPRALSKTLPCKDRSFQDDVVTCARTIGSGKPVLLIGESGTGKTVLRQVFEEYLTQAVPDAVSYFSEILESAPKEMDSEELLNRAL